MGWYKKYWSLDYETHWLQTVEMAAILVILRHDDLTVRQLIKEVSILKVVVENNFTCKSSASILRPFSSYIPNSADDILLEYKVEWN